MDIVQFLRSVEWMCHSKMRGLMENDRPYEAADEIDRLRKRVKFLENEMTRTVGALELWVRIGKQVLGGKE